MLVARHWIAPLLLSSGCCALFLACQPTSAPQAPGPAPSAPAPSATSSATAMATATSRAPADPNGCQPDTLRCERGQPQRCNAQSSWQNEAACAASTYCHAGSCAAPISVSPTGDYAVLQGGGVLSWDADAGVPVAGSAHAIDGASGAKAFVSPHCFRSQGGSLADGVHCIEAGKLHPSAEPPWMRGDLPIEIADATQIHGTKYYGCALMRDKRVQCWGSNRHGQIGIGVIDDGNAAPRPATSVLSLSAVDKVVIGVSHACALRQDGRVVCWGSDECGNLGGPGVRNGIGRAKPGPPLNIQPKVVDIVVAQMGGRGLARSEDGRVYRWGRDCMGLRQAYTRPSPPREVPELAGARSLALTDYGGVAITRDGRLKQWVSDDDGRVLSQADVN